MLKPLVMLVLLAGPSTPTAADCPKGTTLQRHVADGLTWIGCANESGAEGPGIRLRADGGVHEAGRYENHLRVGTWFETERDGTQVQRSYVEGREGPIRACPPGSIELIKCVARCCDVSARACVAADGGLVGPWDEWAVGGRRLGSNLDDPEKPAPFRSLGAVRSEIDRLLTTPAQPPK